MEKMNIKKGLTLIEVNLALAIFMILLAILSPFFYSNFKSLNEADIRLELQRQGEKILEDISKNGMEASGIESPKKDSSNNLKEITFKYENNLIKTWTNKDKEDVKVQPLPDKDKFEDAKGIHVEVILKKKKIQEIVITDIYFRNFKENADKKEGGK